MKNLNDILTELGVSKVRLSKYLGVSRQMLYNYLAMETLNDWPKEKAMKLLTLLNIDGEENIDSIKVDGEYILYNETTPKIYHKIVKKGITDIDFMFEKPKKQKKSKK